jgi:hypothetical protein
VPSIPRFAPIIESKFVGHRVTPECHRCISSSADDRDDNRKQNISRRHCRVVGALQRTDCGVLRHKLFNLSGVMTFFFRWTESQLAMPLNANEETRIFVAYVLKSQTGYRGDGQATLRAGIG